MKSIEGLIDRNYVNAFCIEIGLKFVHKVNASLWKRYAYATLSTHTSQIVRILFVQVWIDLQAEREADKKRGRESKEESCVHAF